jgi:hypothetical protein
MPAEMFLFSQLPLYAASVVIYFVLLPRPVKSCVNTVLAFWGGLKSSVIIHFLKLREQIFNFLI